MEFTFLEFLRYDFPSILLVCGLIVLMTTNRKNKLPAVFTLWIMTIIMVLSLFVEFVCKWSENDPSLADIRYWTTIVKYLIPPTILMMQNMVLVENKVVRWLLVIPNLISAFAVTAGPYVTGLDVLSFNEEYCFVEGPLRVFPFCVALFYLFVLVIASLRYFYDVTLGYNSIVMYLAVTTVIACMLEFFGIVNGIVKYVQIIDIYLYYFFLNFVYQSRIREESLKKELALTQKELELSNTNLRLLQNQISPHFIYNALFLIKALIWTDQKRASDAVDDFSLYTRRNIEAMRSNDLIRFEEELEHIRAFLNIENVDDETGMVVEFNTEELDFLIPPLTVEPLVENALIHGIGTLESGGVITVSSERADGGYMICVEDNGVGFDTENTKYGVGLENAKTRLELQCGGKLDISSRPGCTRATIFIPDRNENDNNEGKK
ncbi:MAG: histidine kinase [Clostridia bacterium]|nr:histidine kinase [Clostridia bacterium]